MKFEKASDNQLLTIAKHDNNCPAELLGGAVIEMMNRGLFDAIIADCIRSVTNIETFEKVHKVGLDDFMQIGRISVLKAVEQYDGSRGKAFISFVFLRVKSQVIKEVVTLEAQKRDARKVVSYNKESENGTEFVDFFFDKNINVEKYVVNKVTIEQLLDRVNEHQRKVIMYRMEGYTFAEISDILGRGSDRTMHQAYRLGIEKMRKGA